MTVSTEVNHNEYTGNGVTTSFPYTFRIFHANDLVVTKGYTNGVLQTLLLNTDYTVTGAGSYTGGSVVLKSPLASGWVITIDRELPVVQETDLRNQGKFFAETHENAFDYLTMLIQQAIYKTTLLDGRSIKVPERGAWIAPVIASRRNKIFAWGDSGEPIAVMPESGSASDVLIELAKPSGAGLVGGTITPITATFLAGGAVAGQDSTAAITAAGARGGTYYVPLGEYVISSAKISKNVTFIFEKGSVFKRAAGMDIHRDNWESDAPMVSAIADGLDITFIDPIFDGNSANQPAVQVGYSGPNATTEPTGWAFRYGPVNGATAKDCSFNFVRPVFKNGTSGYLLIRGDDVNRRFKTKVRLTSPVFTDTIYGYGKGDPATPNPLGYSPDYMQLIDFVVLESTDTTMTYSAVPTPVGRYAPVGIRATYIGGGTPDAAGGPRINLYGTTEIRGVGRKGNYYDNSSNLNNGLGAVDGYGNCESLFVENIIAQDCESQPVRAKASISRFEVVNAYIKNCRGGVQVSPSTTGATEAIVVIGSVESLGGWNPAVEVVGTDGANLIPSVSIGSVSCDGGINGDNRADNAVAGIFIRFCDDVYAEKLVAKNQDKSGIQFRDNQFVKVNYYQAKGVAIEGLTSLNTSRSLVISSGQSRQCGGTGLTVAGNTYNVKLSDIYADGTTDYAIFVNSTAENCEIDHCTARDVSGLSRGFHLAGPGTISNSKIGSGVSTPASGNLFTINQINNSWALRSNLINAGSGAPTLGEFRRGDRISIAASPSGFIGWVCTTAGTAGSTAVFKRFGAIEA